jgi:hypothetical protein
MKKPRRSPDRIKLFHAAVGEMCNEWAHLEQWINRLFLAVGNWDYRQPMALLMSGCIAQRDQIAAIKVGAIERCASGNFLNLTLESLHYVDNDLRIARNRYVHDIWLSSDDGVGAIKIDFTRRIKRDQASGGQLVQHRESKYVAIHEILDVTADIVSERDHLEEIVGCFQNPQDRERAMRLSAPPQRRHLLRQREKQSQMDKVGAAPKPRRKTSPP